MLKHLTDTIVQISILPFSDERFLEKDFFHDLLKSKKIYVDYENMKESTYQQVKEKYHVSNIDSIHMLIEKYYPIKLFQNNQRNSSQILMERLNDISTCFISQRNGEFSLKYWRNDTYEKLFEAFDGFNKIELWNSFSRHFCMDVLVANYLLENGMDKYQYLNGYYWLINIGDLQLDGILKKGVSETHLHMSAGIYFSTMWENLLQITNSSVEKHPFLKEVNRNQYVEEIYQASLFRIFSSKFLSMRRNDKTLNFECFLKHSQGSIQYDVIYSIIKRKQESLIKDYKETYDVFLKEYGTVENLLLDERIHTTPENVFLFESLKYLKTDNDQVYGRLFWRYITLKNIIYQGVTQSNNCSGLLYFQKYFRKATSVVMNTEEYYKSILLNQIYNNYLTKLEVRISPPSVHTNNKKSIKRQMCDYLIQILSIYKKLVSNPYLENRVPQFGMVIHFVKQKDRTFFEKCWCLDETNRYHYFYGKMQKEYLQLVEEIKDLRQNIPELADYIVGIDAASIENNVEPWVFAPIYQAARDSKMKLCNLNAGLQPIKNLGFTYHVGEDFRHILSGLRHIDEVVEHFGYHAGDRIGHGIALGIDVEHWYEANRIVMMPRIEYMENLLWLWGIGKKLHIDFSYLEREILKLADCIYCNLQGINVYLLWKAYQSRFQLFTPEPNYMLYIGACNTNDNVPSDICKRIDRSKQLFWDEKALAHSYHCKCYLERMYEVIQVKVEKSELDMIRDCQKYMREKISSNGIVVETNPSSNLSIADIERLFEHYIISLNQKGLEDAKSDGLIITVNSDDPAVFNTSTSNELAYMFYLLLDKGYSRDTILEWINKVRQWGVDTSFVGDDTKDVKKIDRVIEKLR